MASSRACMIGWIALFVGGCATTKPVQKASAPAAAPVAAPAPESSTTAAPIRASYPEWDASCRAVTDRPNEKSLPLFEKGCEGGDVTGCEHAWIGTLCGFGTAADVPRAAGFAERACKLGAVVACGNAGAVLLQLGEEARAMALLARGCDGNDVGACNNLATLLLMKGDTDSVGKASVILEKACARDNPMSCANLAQILYLGLGVPKDLPRSRRLAEGSCKQSIGIGCNVLGAMRAGESDQAGALQAYEAGCTFGAAAACDNAAQSYQTGRSVAVDLPTAERLYRRGCDLGWAHACTQLGLITH